MAAHIKYPIINGQKQCGGPCGRMLPVSCFRPARKYLSSKCIECISAWNKVYRQRLEVKIADASYRRQYMENPENRKRINENSKRYRQKQKPESKARRNKLRREWAQREKLKAIAYKGGKCVCCGYSGCAAAMDFHHKDPNQKEGYKTGALRSHWTFERNKAEIDKCILVCVRCHREIHAGARKI